MRTRRSRTLFRARSAAQSAFPSVPRALESARSVASSALRACALALGVTALAPRAVATSSRSAQGAASTPRPPLEMFGERAFENDTFVPVSRAAEAALARGDRAWIEASRASRGAPPVEALDRWREALAASERGDLVRAALGDARDEKLPWPPDPAGERERRHVDVELAVLDRLRACDEGATARRALGAWRERFDALADAALAPAGDDAGALAHLAREFPWTRAAAQADLKLADLEYERGARDAGDALVARGQAQLAERDDAAASALRAAFNARARAGPAPAAPPERASSARGSRLTRAERVELAAWSSGVRRVERTRVYAGLARADDASCVVQTPRELVFVGGAAPQRIELAPLLERARATPPDAFADRASDWVHQPACDGELAVLVAGRTTDEADNALLAVDRRSGAALWCWSGAGAWREDAPVASARNLLGGGRLEFEPGPLVFGERVWVHVRCWPAAADAQAGADAQVNELAALSPARFESWVCALDRRSGALVSRTLLARGSSPVAAQEKLNLGIRVLAPQAPPCVCDGGSPGRPGGPGDTGGIGWIDTGLGALASVSLADGRVLELCRATRLRPLERYRGTAAGSLLGTRGASGGPALWAPPDSPSVLACDALRAGRSRLAGADRCIGARADATRLVLRSDGTGWELASDGASSPVRSFDPGRSEPPLPFAAFLDDALVVSTESALYLLDPRTLAVRDRAVLERGCAGAIALERPEPASGAPTRVWVAGERALSCWTIGE